MLYLIIFLVLLNIYQFVLWFRLDRESILNCGKILKALKELDRVKFKLSKAEEVIKVYQSLDEKELL